MKQPISCVIITRNEEANLQRLLPGLSWCDEVLIVDSGSTDDTEKIAKSFGAKFLIHAFVGYGDQKHWAVEQAKNDWILAIDADEMPSPTLIQEISDVMDTISENPTKGFSIEIVNLFLDRPIQLWGTPHRHLRFFNRKFGQFTKSKVHEKVLVEGPAESLDSIIYHYSYRNISHYFDKFNRYTSLGAEDAFKRHRPTRNPLELFFRFPVKFMVLYFFRGGFTLGFPGFVWCLFSAFYPVVKYIKLRELYLTIPQKS